MSVGETIYIENAGLVLTAVYFPRLFEMLDLVHDEPSGNTLLEEIHLSPRAVQLTQYLVDGQMNASKKTLPLNSILCGGPHDVALDMLGDLTDREREVADGMLNVVLTHWEAIKGTSVEGLRNAFLQRPGNLELSDGVWNLKVERKSFDQLVKRIPWTISMIHHPWMSGPLRVDWVDVY